MRVSNHNIEDNTMPRTAARHIESAHPEYNGAYRVAGYKGIAFVVVGWQTEPDEDTEWTGIEERTGALVVCMIGDDRNIYGIDPSDVTPLDETEFCRECGQIGCGHGAAR